MPNSICTKAYLEAVQTYDMYVTEFCKTGLQDIVFVDVVDERVNNIQQRFTADWEEEISLRQYREDIDYIFRKDTAEIQSKTCSGYSAPKASEMKHSNADENELSNMHSSTTGTQSHHLKTDHSSIERDFMYPQIPQSSMSLKPELSSNISCYIGGNAMVSISEKAALEQRPDLIVVLGNLFSKMHSSPDFVIENDLPANSALPQIQDSFAVFGGTRSIPLIFQLLIEDYDQENFKTAIETLGRVTTSHASHLAQVQSVVFTSPILYSSKFNVVF